MPGKQKHHPIKFSINLQHSSGLSSFSGALSRVAGSNIGSYATNQGTLTAGNNYLVTFVPANLTITRAALTITADNKTKSEGTTNPVLTASYSGFVNGDNSTSLTTQPAISTAALTGSPEGTYPISVNGASASNYDIKYVAGTLIITPALPVVSSFTPTTTGSGATVNITGNYFTSASAVSFGGVPASSFNVVSQTSITAVLATGASGSVSVTTSGGTASLNGFIFIPKPTITAGGPTSFVTGGSVSLTASPAAGYTYRWAKGGVEIPNATSSTYTAVESGMYTVSITANSYRITSEATLVTAVYTLPVSNFKVVASGETCKTSNNGKVNIEAVLEKEYTAVLSRNNVNRTQSFNMTHEFADLQAGTYSVCVTVAGQPDYSQCFDVIVAEPQDLAVYTTINKGDSKITLALQGGTNYKVELNGKTYHTKQSELVLSLASGSNSLKVATDTQCQGVIEKTIYFHEEIRFYPNPFENLLNVDLGQGSTIKTGIEVRTVGGKLVYSQKLQGNSPILSIDLSSLITGMYLVKVSSTDSESIFKVVKK